MKCRSRPLLCAGLALTLPLALTPVALAQAERATELANLPFEQNRPTEQTAQQLMEELTFQRATQTYLWALPLLNTMGMRDGAAEAFAILHLYAPAEPALDGSWKPGDIEKAQ